MYTYICIHKDICINVCKYMCRYMDVCICVCIRMCIYMYTYILYMHPRVHMVQKVRLSISFVVHIACRFYSSCIRMIVV